MTSSHRRFAPQVAQLLTLNGTTPPSGEWADYAALGITQADIPELIEMMVDEELNRSSTAPDHWAPLHAWRALGQLRAEAAIQPLIDLLIELSEDDNILNEFSDVMELIGPPALPALIATLDREELDSIIRGAVTEAITGIAKLNPEVTRRAAALLSGRLERFTEQDPLYNGFLVSGLLDLEATDHADVIRRAMTAGAVDEQMVGDWEDVQIALGLLAERTTPRPPSPFHRYLQARDAKLAAAAATRRAGAKRKKVKRKSKRSLSKASRRRNRR